MNGGPQRPALENLVERCADLHADVDLEAVRRWKAADPGRRAFGYLPVYIPAEIVHAAGALPVGLIGGGDRIDVIQGDAYFQSYICRLPRSMVEMGLSGRLDALDGVLFPAICDVIRNLSGVWRLLFADQMVTFVDFPQNFSPGVGGEFYRRQLADLARAIGERTGIPYSSRRLRRSIALYDENRRLIRALHACRASQPDRIPASEAYLVQRAGHLLPVEEHNALLEEYLEGVALRPRTQRDHVRVIVVGAFCEQPPLTLIRTMERTGCDIVQDDFLLGNRFLEEPVGGPGDPLERLARAYVDHTPGCASVYDRDATRVSGLVERVRRTRADGVIFAAPSFCDPALLDQPLYQKALDVAGISYTAFKYSENTGQLGAIREQVGAFAESIRLWGGTTPVEAAAGRSV
ncbi:MAG: benzoyl-CoA reductase subunit C [Acidobacteriota bacterium]